MTKNHSVLITGASGGIGAAIAARLAVTGYAVVLHYHANASRAEQLQEQIRAGGGEARMIHFDIGDRPGSSEALLQDIDTHGLYYGIVCNAGIARDNPFPALEGEDWDQVINTNLNGFFNVLRPLVMPLVQARKPARIITMSSVSGIVGNRGQVNYSAAKAGIVGATKALALELAKRKITVNCVAPGLIETAMIAQAPVDDIIKQIPARRLGQPHEVAALVEFLLSPEAAYITRQVISINGGLI